MNKTCGLLPDFPQDGQYTSHDDRSGPPCQSDGPCQRFHHGRPHQTTGGMGDIVLFGSLFGSLFFGSLFGSLLFGSLFGWLLLGSLLLGSLLLGSLLLGSLLLGSLFGSLFCGSSVVSFLVLFVIAMPIIMHHPH